MLPSEGRGPLVRRLRDVDRIACCGRMMGRLVVISSHEEAATSAQSCKGATAGDTEEEDGCGVAWTFGSCVLWRARVMIFCFSRFLGGGCWHNHRPIKKDVGGEAINHVRGGWRFSSGRCDARVMSEGTRPSRMRMMNKKEKKNSPQNVANELGSVCCGLCVECGFLVV